MLNKSCQSFIERARIHERDGHQQYCAEKTSDTDVWYQVAYEHLQGELQPELKRNGELIIEYWPAWFIVDRENALEKGLISGDFHDFEYGTYGTGYVCLTNRNLHIVALEALTKRFPLNKGSVMGFLADVLNKRINSTRPFKGDRVWTLASGSIIGASLSSDRRGVERVKLVTAAGTWELFEHFFGHRTEVFYGIECLRTGQFAHLKPKWHVTKQPPILAQVELDQRLRSRPRNALLPSQIDQMRAAEGAKMLDLHYLAAQVAQRGSAEVEFDLMHAAASQPNNRPMQKLRWTFAVMRNLLDRCKSIDETLDTIHLRIDRVPELQDCYIASIKRLSRPYFRSLHALPDSPHPALVRTIEVGEIRDPDGDKIEQCFCWGAEGNTAITGGSDGVVRIWSLLTGAVQSQFQAFEKKENYYSHKIRALVLSPDDKTLLTVSLSQGIKAWNTEDWSLQFTIYANEEIEYCAFDANSTRIAYAGYQSKKVVIFDRTTGKPIPHGVTFDSLRQQGDAELRTFRLGPTGDWIVAQILEEDDLEQRLVAVELASGKELFAFREFDVHRFQVSLRQDQILVWSGAGHGLRAWNIISGDWTLKIERSDAGPWDFSPSGRYIWSGCADGNLVVYDANSGSKLYTLEGHLDSVQSAQFSPDEQFVLSKDAKQILKLWDLARADQRLELPSYFMVGDYGFYEDRRKAKACTYCAVNPLDDTAIVINQARSRAAILSCSTGEVSQQYLESITRFPFPAITERRLSQIQRFAVRRCAVSSRSHRILLVEDDAWAVFDSQTLNAVSSEEIDFRRYPDTCALSADGQWVAIARGKDLMVWNLATGKMWVADAKSTIQTCMFDPKVRWVIVAGADGIVGKPEFMMIDLNSEVVCPFENPKVVSKWSSYEQYVLDAWGFIKDCAVTSDGSLVLAAHRSGTLSVWNTSDRSLVNAWQAHEDPGFPSRVACTILPDNLHVLTVALDGMIRLWDINTFRCLCSVSVNGILEDCDVFPDGRRLIVVGETGVFWLEIENPS